MLILRKLALGTWAALGPCAVESGASEPGESSTSESGDGTSVTTDDEPESSSDGPHAEDGSDEYATFIAPIDLPGCDCDPFAQDCPEGEKCVPRANDRGTTWVGHKCVPISGDGQVGEPCTSDGVVAATDSCGAESICWGLQEIDGELIGLCTAFCAGTLDAPECMDGTSCLISQEGAFTLCIDNCDPLAPDCPEGSACEWGDYGFHCIEGSA